MTPVIHFSNVISNGDVYLSVKLQSGYVIDVVWHGEHDPPKQSWWNNATPEWTTIEDIFKEVEHAKARNGSDNR